MSSIHVDGAQLVQFKETLDRTASQFEDIRNSIQSTIDQVSDGWDHPTYVRFREKFVSKSGPDITRLVSTMQDFSRYLQGKIAILEQLETIHF